MKKSTLTWFWILVFIDAVFISSACQFAWQSSHSLAQFVELWTVGVILNPLVWVCTIALIILKFGRGGFIRLPNPHD